MSADFPAAHSMDTTWFAVDAAGHIALFETGENGHVPDLDISDFSDDLEAVLGQPVENPEDEWGTQTRCEHLGLYWYSYDEDFDPIAPYDRSWAPRVPLHIDQLPPDLRARAREVQFRGLLFSEAVLLQPLEFWGCYYWYDDRVAYLCSDGKTVKPIPGREGEFAAFVRKLRQDSPEAAAGLIFDGPEEGDT